MNNKKLGSKVENEVILLLQQNNFFATKLKEREMGAPFDLIGTKDNYFYAFEVKEILNGTRFPISRVEINQRTALKKLREVNSQNYFFVFKAEGQFWITHSEKILSSAQKSIKIDEICENFLTWLEKK